jgi:PAS domain S-box-containing protein
MTWVGRRFTRGIRTIADWAMHDWMGLVGLVLFVPAFVVLGLVSTAVEADSAQAVSFAAPAGLACAVAAMIPRRWLPALGAAIFAGTLLLRFAVFGNGLGPSFAIACANVCEAFVFAWLVNRIWPGVRQLAGRKDVARFFAAAAISASVGASVATGIFAWSDPLYQVWTLRAMGHWLGILVVVPAVLLWRRLWELQPARWVELAASMLVLVVTTQLGFDPTITRVVFPYVPLAVLLVLVARARTPGAIVLPWALAPVAIRETTRHHGPFAQLTGSHFGTIISVQLYGLSAVVCAWLIAAVIAERVSATDALERSNETLEARVDERTAQLAAATRMAEAGANVSEALAEARMDEDVTMSDIAGHLVDALGGACIIGLASEDGCTFAPRVVHAADPVLHRATWEAFAPLRFDHGSEGITGQAITSGRTALAEGRPAELAQRSNPQLRRFIVELGIQDAAVVLMHNRGRVVGTITMVRTTTPYSDAEVQLLEDLAARAGLAIANARLYAEVTASEERFHAAFDDGPIAMALVDLDPLRPGTVLKANDALSSLTGYTGEQLVGQSLSNLFEGVDYEDQLRACTEVLQRDAGPPHVCELPLVRADRTSLWVRYSQSVVWHDSRPSYAVALMQDVTATKHAERELIRRALYDPLTGLANRDLLADHLRLALQQLQRAPGTVAVLYLDVDRFKDVNDAVGHHAGDQLLRAVGDRIAASVRGPDTAARLGGDEFVVLCPGITDELLRHADLAMYEAKKAGRRRWAVYDDTIGDKIDRRLVVEEDLRAALAEHWLVLHYQPVIDLEAERIIGMEALLRIGHPERGLLMPNDFIDVAEESELIVPIGEWVLNETCRQLALWEPFGQLHAAVNVSGRQVATHRMTDSVLGAATAHGVAPTSLTIEMTERVLIEAADQTLDDLQRLTSYGVCLAIDDFGTGYSSLTYLNRFPVDTVKIDRSFIAGLGQRDRDTAIVEAITGLARTLDLTAVAEGVETAEQLVALRALGCTRAQGFHLGRPMPAEAFTELLQSQLAAATPPE